MRTLKDELQRPIIKDYFGKDATLSKVHQTYISQPELFNYAQALDNYIDMLEQESDKKAIEFLNWVNKNYSHYNDNLYSNLEDAELHTTEQLLDIFIEQPIINQ